MDISDLDISKMYPSLFEPECNILGGGNKMNCCGGHEGHKEQKGKEHHGHQEGRGESKTFYIILGLMILLTVIFALKYLK